MLQIKGCNLKTIDILQGTLFRKFVVFLMNFGPYGSPSSAKTSPNDPNFSRNLHDINFHKIFKVHIIHYFLNR